MCGYGTVFLVFSERVRTEGLVTRNDGESMLKPFHVLCPMVVLAEQKYFDLGGVCRVAEHFGIKCGVDSNDLMFNWPNNSAFKCGEVCVVAFVITGLWMMIRSLITR